VKIFADGSLIGRTAAMHSDYADVPGERGYFQIEPDVLCETIRRVHAAGWQIATHAIGDRAVSEVIDAYESALTLHPRTDHRHRIEHCAVTSPRDVDRIARLGLVPVPQGRFIHELGDGMRVALGPERTQWAYRQRSFVDAGVVVPASSDRPVVNGAPLLGLRGLIERRTAAGEDFTPHERLTPAQALRAYTLGSAYANFTEDRLGTIEVGKYADLAVLTGDPLSTDQVDTLTVLATVIGGEFAYDAAGLC
jgi:predicted amidohydrolase YtcJ